MDPTDMTLPPDSDALSPSPDSILSPNSSGGGGGGSGRRTTVLTNSIATAGMPRQQCRIAESGSASARPPVGPAVAASTPASAGGPATTARDLAYQRRRERNNEAARASRLNRKARYEATRRALARLQATAAPLARLRRIQTEMEVRGMCAAAGQDYDRLLVEAASQIGIPADYFAAVVRGVVVGGNPPLQALQQQQQQQQQHEIDPPDIKYR